MKGHDLHTSLSPSLLVRRVEYPTTRKLKRQSPLPYQKFTFSGGFLDPVWVLLVYCLVLQSAFLC
jgi:hypothetical protein